MGTVIVGKATQSAVTAKLSCVVISASFSVLRGEKAEEREMVLVFARREDLNKVTPLHRKALIVVPPHKVFELLSAQVFVLYVTKFYVKQNVKLLFLLMVSAWFRLGCTE